MPTVESLINRKTWERFVQFVKMFAASEDAGRKAKWLFALLIALLFGTNGLNVLNSYVGRDFMTAIEDHNRTGFVQMAFAYLAVFAASTLVTAFYRYMEERLSLLWREWATGRYIHGYADKRVYFRLKMAGELENPDQRIAEDIRACTLTAISFLLMLLNGSITVFAFSGVLWSISPLLFLVSIFYAAGGTFLTYLLGHRLVRLNFDQLDKEAKFRASLIHLRANAESVALCRREGRLIRILMQNLGDLTKNFRRIITTNRNVNLFTTGYNWLLQIIPALIIAPLFMDGRVKFGVIAQSTIAFTHLLGAFSLIVTQFQSLSSFTAVISRLSSLMDALEEATKRENAACAIPNDSAQVVYTGLTLRSVDSERILLCGLSLVIPHGRRLLVCGPDDAARMALFRATAGLWEVNEGHIVRPKLEEIIFLTERPYLPRGTFRDLFMRPWAEEGHPDDSGPEDNQLPEEAILEALRALNLEDIPRRSGGMDTPQTWESILTLAEQQLLVIARVLVVRPRFAFLDKPSTTLSPEQVRWALNLLSERSVSYVTFEAGATSLESHDTLLEIDCTGQWTCRDLKDGHVVEDISDISG